MFRSHELPERRVGLALSGGAVRGIAHIGVLKALEENGIQPTVVAGTSAGSIIGAAIASGMHWRELTQMAYDVFWPSLLHGPSLERFCLRQFPLTFADLPLPFAAVATSLPARKTVIFTSGRLAPAINASCCVRVVRRPVRFNGEKLKDGGISCVLPSIECRQLGADFVVGSDVWELSALLRGFGLAHTGPRTQYVYPDHYIRAVRNTDLLIIPKIPMSRYWPNRVSIDRLIAAGEKATRDALKTTGWKTWRVAAIIC